jgi:hypothetical protein
MAAPDQAQAAPRRSARMWRPGLRYYCLAAAPFLVVFALIPFSIYVHSGDDWDFGPLVLVDLVAIGLALLVAAALVLRLLASLHEGVARGLAAALFCIGMFLLLAHVYAPIQIGPLDGEALVSDEPLGYSIFEAALFVALLLALVPLQRGRGLAIASLCVLLLTVVSVGYFAHIMIDSATTGDAKPRRAQRPAATGGNVYHLVLDTMQTDAFLAAARRDGLLAPFEGFQLFENNVSNYITTVSSSASYLTSTFYDSGNYKDWTRSWRSRGLFKTMSDLRYETWMYAPFSHWDNDHIDHFWYDDDIYEQEMGFTDTGFYDFVHVWLASLAPNFLTSEALRGVEPWRDRLYGLLVGQAKPLSTEAGLHAYASVLMLRRLAREEADREPRGHYLYAHAILPHGPFVMDAHCNYVGKHGFGRKNKDARRAAYVDQAGCAIRLVTAFLDRLKTLGRYDAATIVVHADTGHGLGFIDGSEEAAGGTTLGKPNQALLSSVNALLMIKPPHAEGPLEIVDSPSQLADLLPTLLTILAVPPPDYELRGRPLQSIAGSDRRAAVFGFDPDKKHGPNLIEVRIENQMDLKRSALTVLGPATDPATWQAAFEHWSPTTAARDPEPAKDPPR